MQYEDINLNSKDFKDYSTSVYNKNFFIENINKFSLQMIKGIQENKKNNNNNQTWSILFCDIDGLKSINDKYGFVEGDNIISRIAGIIKDCIRTNRSPSDSIVYLYPENIPIRVGGDEFIILCPFCTKENAEIIKDRIKCRMEQSSSEIQKTTISIGTADSTEIEIDDNFDTSNDEEVSKFINDLITIAEKRMKQDKKRDYTLLSEKELQKLAFKICGRIEGFDVTNADHYDELMGAIYKIRNRVADGNYIKSEDCDRIFLFKDCEETKSNNKDDDSKKVA
jgi:diguanylate cyclase (GGDEF)-like protein